MKKIIFVGFLFLLLPISYVRAALVFSEVMYDPPGTGTGWIEVYNNGTQSVDLTKYFLYTDGPASTKHSITQKGTGSTILSSGAYAIIADDQINFNSSYPNLLSVDSSFSIPTTRTSVFILTTDTVKPPVLIDDQITLDPSLGAKNDGNSLQKNSSGIWIPATPTPGAINAENATMLTTTTTTTATSTTQNNSPAPNGLPANDFYSSSAINTQAQIPQAVLFVQNTALVGVPVDITTQLYGVENVSHNSKSFHVSLGDGTEYNYFSPTAFTHAYKYPGMYVVSFEYKQNPYDPSNRTVLSARKIIEVVSPSIVINSTNPDGSVELLNSDSKETDLSNWVLQSTVNPNDYFIVPEGTIILPGKKITLPIEATNFSNQNIKSLVLYLPSGQTADIYSADETRDTTYRQVTPIQTSHNESGNYSVPITSNLSSRSTAVGSTKTKKKNMTTVASISETLTQKDVDSVASNTLLEARVDASLQNGNSKDFSWPIVVVGVIGLLVVGFVGMKNKNLWEKKEKFENNSQTRSAKEIADEIHIIDD